MSSQPVIGESPPVLAPSREEEITDEALAWLRVNVLKQITTRVVPLVVTSGVVVGGLAWLQDEIGVDLPTGVVASVTFTVMATIALAVLAYIHNHAGAAKLGAVLLELQRYRAEVDKAKRDFGPRV